MGKTEPGMCGNKVIFSVENETQECWNLSNRTTVKVNMARIPVQTYNDFDSESLLSN